MQRFTELHVWQRSHALVLQLYRATASFPSEERYGLTSQLRRAALSIPTNIAEGSKRVSRQEYAHFLNVAEGSLAETEYLLMVARDLGHLRSEETDSYLHELTEIARMLNSLRTKVGSRQAGPARSQLSTLNSRPKQS